MASETATSAPYMSAMRKVTDFQNLAIGLDRITLAAQGMQQRRREALVDLVAQAADLHVNDVGARVEVAVPHRLEEHGAGDHLALVAHHELQQTELPRPEQDGFAGPLHLALDQVH